jgi:hypothetical protein
MKSRHLSLPKRKAEFIEPMECAPVTKLLDGLGWVYEIKLDDPRSASPVPIVVGGAIMIAVGLIAAYLPVRRAMRVESHGRVAS